MHNRRLAFILGALPLAFYAYACSDSKDDPPPATVDEAGGGSETGSPIDGGGPGDTSVPDGAKLDGGDASVPVTCVGNPLTADGGTPDGGANVTARAINVTYPFNVAQSFLDGPQWLDNAAGGELIFTQVFSDPRSVLRVGPNGGAATIVRGAPAPAVPIGNATRNGVIYTAVSRDDNATPAVIWQTSTTGDAGTSILAAPATNPNDLVVHSSGTIFFTDPQFQNAAAIQTGVYRVGADGGVVTAVQTGLVRPNGIALTPDGTKLYVGLANAITVYTVAADGTPSAAGAPFLGDIDLADSPDGLAVDSGGNLWVAEAAADTNGRVEVFSPTKQKLGTILFAGQRPTGIAFGGADGKTVFITTETNLHAYDSRCPGVK